MINTFLDIKSGKAEPWCGIQIAAYTLLDIPVEFNEKGHIYTLRGEILPSVTHILKSEGFIDTLWYDDWSRTKGTYVHKAVQLYIGGILNEKTLDPEIVPYLEAWKKFIRESGFVVTGSEISGASKDYKFAGTYDVNGYFPGGTTRGCAIELHKDGTYRIVNFTFYQDMKMWFAAWSCYNWKKNNLKRKD